jgi:hypothetical protein
MPRIHPKTWEDGVMPLSEFPQAKQDEIACAVAEDKPPPRWLNLEMAQIESRAWYEWHWARGKKLRWVGAMRPARKRIPDGIRFEVFQRDGYKCLHCGTDENLSLDHIHPYSLGGTDAIKNLQTLCRPCNSRKGART